MMYFKCENVTRLPDKEASLMRKVQLCKASVIEQ